MVHHIDCYLTLPLDRCYFSKENDRFKLVRLLSLLGMESLMKNLQMDQVHKQREKDLNLNLLGGGNTVRVRKDLLEEKPGLVKEMECKVCNVKYDSKKLVEFIIHERECGVTKDEAMKKVASPRKVALVVSAAPLSKRCPICKHDIKAAGRGWRYPFYSHLARRHFSSLLKRDYVSEDWKCLVCLKDAESFAGPSKRGQLIAHLGGKHRLVENYINLDENGEVIKSTSGREETIQSWPDTAQPKIDLSRVYRKGSLSVRCVSILSSSFFNNRKYFRISGNKCLVHTSLIYIFKYSKLIKFPGNLLWLSLTISGPVMNVLIS